MRRVPSLGAAHTGTGEWMLQRLSALYLALCLLLAVAAGWSHPYASYGRWLAFWSTSWVRWAALLFGVSLLVHTWLGLRSVLRDYVHRASIRLFAELVLGALLFGEGIWGMRMLGL
ncbi:MAG TPA: succinate dehydrogenase, hydrophobic membrane anchor protein [Acidiferrobacteraceae bacterium]|nr:succinate dehydrogenase, hydrophobic membrane anchor protein [Acidiferrobacteraceae bacterium]